MNMQDYFGSLAGPQKRKKRSIIGTLFGSVIVLGFVAALGFGGYKVWEATSAPDVSARVAIRNLETQVKRLSQTLATQQRQTQPVQTGIYAQAYMRYVWTDQRGEDFALYEVSLFDNHTNAYIKTEYINIPCALESGVYRDENFLLMWNWSQRLAQITFPNGVAVSWAL